MPGLASFRVLGICTIGNGDRRIHEFSAIRAMAHRGLGSTVIEIEQGVVGLFIMSPGRS